MLFALCLAFSFGSFAQDAQCPDGGTYYEGHGCGIPFEEGTEIKWVGQCEDEQALRTEIIGDSFEEINLACHQQNSGNQIPGYCRTDNHRHVDTRTIADLYYVHSNPVYGCTVLAGTVVVGKLAHWAQVPVENTCPEDFPNGPVDADGTKICLQPSQPCDCSDLTGSNPQGINYFYAANGTYSQANPPNCISRDDNESGDIPSCNCKLIATKWASADVNINGTIYQRWQPIPDQNGVTGVFTGGQCDESEKDTPPETPEKCYQLGNGQNFCLEDPDQKCAKIDGIMTCEAGCGTVNGEFFCFENDDPEEPLPDPDDDITDPDTPLNNMIKSDFKDVLGGTESRLDILARLMSDIKTNTSKGDGNLAAKQDATNRLLKEISDKLDEEGDDEAPTNPQPTYNTDKLEEFVNPNDWGEKNFRTVALAFKDRLLEAPVMQAVQGFFDVALSGSCPTWQTTVNMPFGGVLNINIDQLCSETMNNIWPAIRAIIVLIFSFLAFRVAFTNE